MNYKINKNMLIAFFLNFIFSIFEILGGKLSYSSAIFADGIHDLCDAASIALSLYFKKISTKEEDKKYTYGYGRYNVIGAIINLIILSSSAVFIIIQAVPKIINPETINYNGMIVFAIIGIILNATAVLKTKNYKDISEKVINIHMLEDLLGWILVLISAVIIRLTGLYIIDPILSLLIAVFIIINVFKNAHIAIDIILEKTPSNINIEEIKEDIKKIKHVKKFYHIHIWTIDGTTNCLTAHVEIEDSIDKKEISKLKKTIKTKLLEKNIQHITLEIKSK